MFYVVIAIVVFCARWFYLGYTESDKLYKPDVDDLMSYGLASIVFAVGWPFYLIYLFGVYVSKKNKKQKS